MRCHIQRDNCPQVIWENDCPQGVSNDIAAKAVDAAIKDPDLLKHLTFWYSEIVITPATLADQNASAQQALKAIDAELAGRK